MEIYLLDTNYKRIMYLDEFESFIWTERYSEYGDFEMVLNPSIQWNRIRPGYYLAHTGTKSIMIIEDRDEKVDSDGRRTLTISGRGMESILDHRVLASDDHRIGWNVSGTMGTIVTQMVKNICQTGFDGISDNDIIPSFYTFDETTDTEWIRATVRVKSLYEVVKEMCDSKDMGFGIDLTPTDPRLRFFVSQGVTRSNIYFSSSLDTLTEEASFFSNRDFKTTAYVFTKDGMYKNSYAAPGMSINRSGLDRRVLFVDASDIDPPAGSVYSDYNPLMRQRAMEELAKHKDVKSFDAKLTGLEPFVFHTHYTLGDIVTLIDREGAKWKVRVTEYIWSINSSGSTAYPTFSALS